MFYFTNDFVNIIRQCVVILMNLLKIAVLCKINIKRYLRNNKFIHTFLKHIVYIPFDETNIDKCKINCDFSSLKCTSYDFKKIK